MFTIGNQNASKATHIQNNAYIESVRNCDLCYYNGFSLKLIKLDIMFIFHTNLNQKVKNIPSSFQMFRSFGDFKQSSKFSHHLPIISDSRRALWKRPHFQKKLYFFVRFFPKFQAICPPTGYQPKNIGKIFFLPTTKYWGEWKIMLILENNNLQYTRLNHRFK